MLSLLVLLLAPVPTVDYARASATLGATHGTWHHDGSLIMDGRDDTAWCAPWAAGGPRVAFEFSAPVKVDKIRIALGSSRKISGFGPASRPRILTLSNMTYVWQIVMPDDEKPFEMPIPPPITGQQLSIRVDAVHRPGDTAVCIAELTLYQDGQPLRLAKRRGDPSMPSIEGVWTPAGQLSPERFVVFYRDGRLRLRDQPDTREPARDRFGKWRRDGAGVIAFEVGGRTIRVSATMTPDRDGRPRLTGDDLLDGTWTPWVPDATYGSYLW
ncbi:MAG: hypothetical protein R3F60_17330 [bacterium]